MQQKMMDRKSGVNILDYAVTHVIMDVNSITANRTLFEFLC
jgi:hypothetical protein